MTSVSTHSKQLSTLYINHSNGLSRSHSSPLVVQLHSNHVLMVTREGALKAPGKYEVLRDSTWSASEATRTICCVYLPLNLQERYIFNRTCVHYCMMSVSKDAKDGNIFERALKEYVRLLQQRPVLTKSVTK